MVSPWSPLVPKGNFYRRLEERIDLSFVRELVQQLYARGGRHSVDPVVFFKLQLVMFFEDIRSERQLMEVVADRLSLRWYVGVRRLTGRWISPTGRRGSEECWTCEQWKGGHREDSKIPGSTAYPEAKADGNNSMPLKRMVPEGVYGIDPQGPRDTARTKLFESQFPVMQYHISRSQRLLKAGPPAYGGVADAAKTFRLADGGKRSPSRERTGCLSRARECPVSRECGIAYGARALRRRSLHSSPRTEKPSTWRREAGVLDVIEIGRCARCAKPKLS